MMEKMEITAEQILRKYLPEPVNQAEVNDDINIIKAMEDYANIVKNHGVSHHVSDQRKLLIDFINWWKENRAQYETPEILDVPEFLNQ